MKLKLLFVTFFVTILSSNATVLNDSLTLKRDSINNWKNINKVRFLFTQNSFVNWSAGGNNSISGILKINLTRILSAL